MPLSFLSLFKVKQKTKSKEGIMDAFEVVNQETKRMLRGFIPLALILYAGFSLFGYYHIIVLLSIIVGTAYSLFLFYNMAVSAVHAALIGDEKRASRIQTSRYLMRYLLTGIFLVGVIKLTPLNPVAVTIPLFFPKIILIASGIIKRKGG